MTTTLPRTPGGAPAKVAAPERLGILRLAAGAVITGLGLALALRFWTTSPLWLDESQSVAIARLPLLRGHGTTMWTGLRQDGSPPLYYLLLHAWIRVFGTGSSAVRALSGLLSVSSFPLLWRLARRFGGRFSAMTSVLLFATSPFAVRFATETRMYSLIVLLTLTGGLALERVLDRGARPLPLLGLAASSGSLALTHYWSFFLLATVGGTLVAGCFRGDHETRHRRRWAVAALAGGGVLFVPWLPGFVYQLRHTGTPWGSPAAMSAVVHAFGEWTGGPSTWGRLTLLVVAALLIFAVFGTPLDGRRLLLDLRGHDPGRMLMGLSVGTLVVAVVGGQIGGTAWADRYTATAFVPFLVAAGLGVQAIGSRRVAAGFVAAACAFGLLGSVSDVTTDRTNAAQVAAAVNARWHPGDVVLACPDQLGPALARELRPGATVLAVPTLQPADRVDWVDYARRQRAADASVIVQDVGARAAPTGTVFLAVSAGYTTYKELCPKVQHLLAVQRPRAQVLVADSPKTFEHAALYEFRPAVPSAG